MSSHNFSENDRDFDAIFDAVSATDQGRWFLEELSRRNRHADTMTILDALQALSAENSSSLAEASQVIPPHIASELGEISDSLVRFRHKFEQSSPDHLSEAIPQFLDDMEHHILRTLDFLGVTDSTLEDVSGARRSDILSKLPPELADEAALIDGFDDESSKSGAPQNVFGDDATVSLSKNL